MMYTSEVLDFPQFNHIRMTIKIGREVTSLCYLSPRRTFFVRFYPLMPDKVKPDMM